MTSVISWGIDGCPEGLVVASRCNGSLTLEVLPDFTAVFDGPWNIIAVDIPIGLLPKGPREADRLARQVLGSPRKNSVFTAPIRPMLMARDRDKACDIRYRIEGKKVTHQAWGTVKKVREVDDALRARPEGQRRVHEIHPEVSFATMAGTPMKYRKKDALGRRSGSITSSTSSPSPKPRFATTGACWVATPTTSATP